MFQIAVAVHGEAMAAVVLSVSPAMLFVVVNLALSFRVRVVEPQPDIVIDWTGAGLAAAAVILACGAGPGTRRLTSA